MKRAVAQKSAAAFLLEKAKLHPLNISDTSVYKRGVIFLITIYTINVVIW